MTKGDNRFVLTIHWIRSVTYYAFINRFISIGLTIPIQDMQAEFYSVCSKNIGVEQSIQTFFQWTTCVLFSSVGHARDIEDLLSTSISISPFGYTHEYLCSTCRSNNNSRVTDSPLTQKSLMRYRVKTARNTFDN
jgi:hypothetical protein